MRDRVAQSRRHCWPASRRLSRPKGAVRCHKPGEGGSTRTERSGRHLSRWINCSITCARSSRTALTARLVPMLCVSLHLSADRDCARSFTAQIMGPSRAPRRPFGHICRLQLKVEVLDLLRRLGEDERRAQTSARACRYREPPADHGSRPISSFADLLSPALLDTASPSLLDVMPTCQL